MNLRHSRRSMCVAVVVGTVAVAAVIAIADYVLFERACGRVIAVATELGGRPASIGGWPIGREFVVRFDGPLSDDAIRRLAASAGGSRRIYVMAYLAGNVSKARLAAMRAAAEPYAVRIVVSGEMKGH